MNKLFHIPILNKAELWKQLMQRDRKPQPPGTLGGNHDDPPTCQPSEIEKSLPLVKLFKNEEKS